MQLAEAVVVGNFDVGRRSGAAEHERNARVVKGLQRVLKGRRPVVEQRPRELQVYLVHREEERVGDL